MKKVYCENCVGGIGVGRDQKCPENNKKNDCKYFEDFRFWKIEEKLRSVKNFLKDVIHDYFMKIFWLFLIFNFCATIVIIYFLK